MQVKLFLPVGDDLLCRMIDLPFAPFVDLQLELASTNHASAWSLVILTEVVWRVVESQFECECYVPMCDDRDSKFFESRGWVPLS